MCWRSVHLLSRLQIISTAVRISSHSASITEQDSLSWKLAVSVSVSVSVGVTVIKTILVQIQTGMWSTNTESEDDKATVVLRLTICISEYKYLERI